MNKLISALAAASVLGLATSAHAAMDYYVAQDVKSHACTIVMKKPDGKTMMDVGTKVYDSEDNAKKALTMLKVCGAGAAPVGFYVGQDAKTHACAVMDKAPDGKAVMDVGTKVYESEENAKKALANLKACDATPAKATGFYVGQDAKTKKCTVLNKAPDGKTVLDVGTKVYESEDNAKKALANLKVCG